MAMNSVYTKKPLTLLEQIERLKQRGLIFDDEKEALAYLFNKLLSASCIHISVSRE